MTADTPATNAGSTPSTLLVFVRAPRQGTVKTRLAAQVGEARARVLYRRMAEATLAAARGLGGVELRVLFTPADAGDEVRAWLGDGPRYLPQGEGDLGTRMHAAFAAAFADGARRVVVVGSDLPELSTALLQRAFACLETRDAVVGPARDGGYYLLGLRRALPEVFDGVAWSTPGVLAATLERLRAAGVEPALLEALADVDVADDLPPDWRG